MFRFILTIDQLNDDNGPLYYLKNGNKLGSLSKIENIIENQDMVKEIK